MDTAYFVKHPRTIEDLQKPHLLDDERPYEMVADVKLATIDYENFITDMLADRQFIEDNAGLCGEGEIMKCIFVHRRGRAEGILAVPEAGAAISSAAYIRCALPLPLISRSRRTYTSVSEYREWCMCMQI